MSRLGNTGNTLAQLLWFQKISEQLADQSLQQNSSYIEQGGKVQSLLDLFTALALPSSPAITREVTVNAARPELLYQNTSLPFARIEVTNDDPAQFMYVGVRNVSVNIGRVITAQETVPFVVPESKELWGICIIATLSCRISEAFDLLGEIQVIRPQEMPSGMA